MTHMVSCCFLSALILASRGPAALVFIVMMLDRRADAGELVKSSASVKDRRYVNKSEGIRGRGGGDNCDDAVKSSSLTNINISIIDV